MAHRSLSNSMNKMAEGLREAKIKNEEPEEEKLDTMGVEPPIKPEKMEDEFPAATAMKAELDFSAAGANNQKDVQSEKMEEDIQEVGGDITLKMEPGESPKLARTSSHKVPARTVPLFDHLPDATEEALSTFQLITNCTYSPKSLGDTEHAMECDCAEEWDEATKTNIACGEDSDCINRATKMECYGDCGCGNDCENQRFQRQQWARVSVINTEKKGRGLRADANLRPGEFIFEYIGEVVNETQFRKRMVNYDEEGIKHFYFMSLNRGEFVDATKRGNLGRFCNHSCNPNCYVDKWVVGNKLRMGIFAERKIKAGEELVFNYNVDRYGADPQPCYCGEPNCTGFIGGKTQTERATKLPQITIEALGIDDGDGWDTAVAKRPRKKRAGEDDEEYVNNVQPRSLDEDGVTKVMASLLQNKEKWITVKLLSRIEHCEEERIISRVVKMHGYQILKSVLTAWKEDVNVVIQVFNVLDKFPRLTKNKITDSKIEETIEEFKRCGDDRIEGRAENLLQAWSTLETAYRIPRKKRDPNAPAEQQVRDTRNDPRRRSRSRSKSSSPPKSPPRGPSIPSGPRGGGAGRGGFFHGNRPPFRPPRPFGALPEGWFQATSNGRTYYYTSTGHTQWQRPTAPASKPAPPPPPRATSANKALDDIINEITSAKTKTPEKPQAAAAPSSSTDEPKPEKRESKEKWKQYSEEKQKKIYENTLFPHVKSVVDRYKHELPKEDCKRFFKEVCKKLVNSDYKNNRVQNPTYISEKQIKNVKKYTKDFFDKAVAKKKAHNLKKERKKSSSVQLAAPSQEEDSVKKEEESDIEPMEVSDEEPSKDGATKTETPATPLEQHGSGENHKRKRVENSEEGVGSSEGVATPSKRATFASPSAPPAPPPPPPPMDGIDDLLMDEASIDPEGQLPPGEVSTTQQNGVILPLDGAAVGAATSAEGTDCSVPKFVEDDNLRAHATGAEEAGDIKREEVSKNQERSSNGWTAEGS